VFDQVSNQTCRCKRFVYLSQTFRWYFSTAGSTLLAPQVGAVTIFPPDAFSSETARHKQIRKNVF
jgi:hypothetical protein